MEKVVVYLKAQQQKEINVIEVKVADICQVWCKDKTCMDRVNNITLYEFKPREEKRTYKKVFSILDVIDKISEVFPDVTVISLGEAEFVVEYTSKIGGTGWKNAAKIVVVCVLVFFGSAFTIMAFNNDISITGVFEHFYSQILGKEKPVFSELELFYSIGLAVGIVAFFNHIGNKKLSDDVTPIEVEMNKHRKDTYETIIDSTMEKEYITGGKRK